MILAIRKLQIQLYFRRRMLSALRHGGVRWLFAGVGGEGEEAVADFAVEAFVGFAVLAP